MRIFISTGEVSGDLQGSLLIEALYRQAKMQNIDLEILALGGDRMEKAGAKLIGNTTSIGSVGLFESVPFIIPTLKVQGKAKQYLKENKVDLLILIDYLGPNLAIGSYIRKVLPNLPIIYYIAPQAWVWSLNDKTTNQIVNITDKLLAIFPEEAKFYQEKGASVTYVGHPLLDRMKNAPSREESRLKLGLSPQETVITLLPASRKQEIKYLLPVMCESAKKIQEKLPDVKFLLPISLSSYTEKIKEVIDSYKLNIRLLNAQPLEAISASDLAITKSGTVNLEIALLNVPQVVLYRVHPVTYWIACNILKFSIPFMSPVNLVSMTSIVPELLQEKATVENITQESLALLLNQEVKSKMLHDYEVLRQNLGQENVCDRSALEIFKYLKID
jgi:lipid-A-disaccharide synthase